MNPTGLPPHERHARGTELCRRLTADVAAIAPKGIGSWPAAWDLVDPATADFMVAITAWEAAPSEPARLRVRAAYRGVLDAWHEAARRYDSLRQEADR